MFNPEPNVGEASPDRAPTLDEATAKVAERDENAIVNELLLSVAIMCWAIQ